MRRLNLFLVFGMLVTFLIHGIFGALEIAGANADAQKAVAWICLVFVAAHIVVTTVLTVRTLRARRLSGAGYFKDNLLFWIRRISGFSILIPLVLHLMIFRAGNAEAYRLQAFTVGRMVSQILFIATIALHVLTNIKPLMIALGLKGRRAYALDAMLILSVLLLLFAAAFAIYYVRWAAN